MENISGFGLTARVTASNTFPNGFQVTKFADDVDPLESPDVETADTAYGLNGDLVTWSRATGIEVAISVLPNSDEEENVSTVVEANRVAKGKRGARDVITLVLDYPDGSVATCTNGVVVAGPVVKSVQSSGRIKSRTMRMRFETITRKAASA